MAKCNRQINQYSPYALSSKSLAHSPVRTRNIFKTITRIEECYYFDPEEQGYVEDITKATKGKAIVAWRIQFSDGESIEIESK